MPAPSVGLRRSSVVSALVPISLLLLSSCSDGTPTSPATAADAPSYGKASRGRVAIEVARKGKLLDNGNVEIKARALCPRGYVREESGLLQLEQGTAIGEGSVQLQLGGCTGRWQSGKVLVFPFGDSPFVRGRARVQVTFAVVNSSDPTGMDQLQASVDQTVRLR